jgi:hypothetical protein
MTYTFGNADIRIKNGYILFNAFLSLQISFICFYKALNLLTNILSNRLVCINKKVTLNMLNLDIGPFKVTYKNMLLK